MVQEFESNREDGCFLLSLNNVWMKHFRLLVVAVVVVGLAVGAVLASVFAQPGPSIVVAPTRTFGNFGGQGSAQANGSGAGQTQAAGTGQGATAAQAGGLAGSRPVFGSVSSVTADAITVKAQQGDVNVKLSGAKVTKTVDGTTADLKAGETVSVVGQQQSDGSYNATTVQVLPANQPQRGTANAQRNAGGTAQSGGNGGNSGQARTRPLTGSVKSVDKGVMTVTAQQGDVKVNLGSAKIEKVVDATTKDLQSGQQVLVTGQQGSDGSYTASQIEILPAGAGAPATVARGQRSASAQTGAAPTASGR